MAPTPPAGTSATEPLTDPPTTPAGSAAPVTSHAPTSPPTTVASTTTLVLPPTTWNAGEDCVETFTPETVRHRAFAFEGTVLALSEDPDPQAPDYDSVVLRAQFEVQRWFSGGSDATVWVWMQRSLSIGDRMLVAGEPRWGGAPLDDAVSWGCGFTVAAEPAIAAVWAAAFDEVPTDAEADPPGALAGVAAG